MFSGSVETRIFISPEQGKERGNHMSRKQIRWCAIGDSFTYLNDHLDETGYRVTKGYLDRILEQVPELELTNIGINGSTVSDWVHQPIPAADLYTILLGTNDWNHQNPLGTQEDFQRRREGTILGNYGIVLDHIRSAGPNAVIIAANPVERADFVYILDPHNHAQGSYAEAAGQRLSDVASAILEACRSEGIVTVDLHGESGFAQDTVIRFKRVKKEGRYENLPYPDYAGIPFDPDADEYPYPREAMALTYDGLHPTDQGNQRIADLFAEQIKKSVMQLSAPRSNPAPSTR